MKTTWFVDEAGDTTLFGRYGKVLASTDAVSRFFMVARLEVVDIDALQSDMDALRLELLADPLLKTVPSMQESAGKTALFFHAKADGHDIYDDLIAKLFGRFGEFGVQRHITFAVRGSKPRTAALKTVLDNIDEGFKGDFGFAPHGHTTVHSGYPSASAGLQACDYLLWAFQRFYERAEERYLHAMWPKFTQVLDLDAPAPKTKGKPLPTGVAFNEKHPLTLESRAGVWNKDREI